MWAGVRVRCRGLQKFGLATYLVAVEVRLQLVPVVGEAGAGVVAVHDADAVHVEVVALAQVDQLHVLDGRHAERPPPKIEGVVRAHVDVRRGPAGGARAVRRHAEAGLPRRVQRRAVGRQAESVGERRSCAVGATPRGCAAGVRHVLAQHVHRRACDDEDVADPPHGERLRRRAPCDATHGPWPANSPGCVALPDFSQQLSHSG